MSVQRGTPVRFPSPDLRPWLYHGTMARLESESGVAHAIQAVQAAAAQLATSGTICDLGDEAMRMKRCGAQAAISCANHVTVRLNLRRTAGTSPATLIRWLNVAVVLDYRDLPPATHETNALRSNAMVVLQAMQLLWSGKSWTSAVVCRTVVGNGK